MFLPEVGKYVELILARLNKLATALIAEFVCFIISNMTLQFMANVTPLLTQDKPPSKAIFACLVYLGSIHPKNPFFYLADSKYSMNLMNALRSGVQLLFLVK